MTWRRREADPGVRGATGSVPRLLRDAGTAWGHRRTTTGGVVTASSVAAQQLSSLGSFVGGRDVESGQWVYALSARALLDDSFASLTLKRNLEAGRIAPEEAPPGVVIGRVSVATAEAVTESLERAARAARTWRAAPVSVRVRDWNELLAKATGTAVPTPFQSYKK